MEEKKFTVANSHSPALSQTKDGSLVTRLFDKGLLEIESSFPVSVQIDRIGPDYNFPFPDGAVYRISTYISRPNEKEVLPGTIYINSQGEFLLPDGTRTNLRG